MGGGEEEALRFRARRQPNIDTPSAFSSLSLPSRLFSVSQTALSFQPFRKLSLASHLRPPTPHPTRPCAPIAQPEPAPTTMSSGKGSRPTRSLADEMSAGSTIESYTKHESGNNYTVHVKDSAGETRTYTNVTGDHLQVRTYWKGPRARQTRRRVLTKPHRSSLEKNPRKEKEARAAAVAARATRVGAGVLRPRAATVAAEAARNQAETLSLIRVSV